MHTGSKILLLTDFSTVSGYAKAYAKQIASSLQSTIEVMHVLSTPVDWVHLDKEQEQFYPQTLHEIERAKALLQELVKEFSDLGLEAYPTLIFSFGSEMVFEHVNKSQAELIIMGSEGRGSSKPFFLGSMAQKILRNVKTPTLIVKEEPKNSVLKKIGFLSTLQANQRGVFQQLKTFANLLGADMDLITINTPYQFRESPAIQKGFDQLLTGDNTTRPILLNAENPQNGILFYSEKNHPDILALAKTEKSGITKFFSPSLTENLVRIHSFPILSIYLKEDSALT